MQVSKFLGWEVHFPTNYSLYRKPLGMRLVDDQKRMVVEAAFNLNGNATVSVKRPVQVSVNVKDQQIVMQHSPE